MQGLINTCVLKRRVSLDDNNGGVEDGLATVIASLNCRRTSLSGQLADQKIGITGSEGWRFSTDPILDLPRQEDGVDIIYVIEYAGSSFDVSWWEPRVNGSGEIDHMEFRVELR